MAILKAALVYHVASVYASYVISAEEEVGAGWWDGGTAVAVSTQK